MMGDRVAELIAELASLHPGVAKCVPATPLTDEELDIRAAKIAFVELLDELRLSNRRAAELLGKSPSLIDGWTRLGALDRRVPAHIASTLRRRHASESGSYQAVSSAELKAG